MALGIWGDIWDTDIWGPIWAAGGGGGNTAPATPTCTVDSNDHNSVNLSSSAFSDVDGDNHAASQWQVTTDADAGFATPVIDSGEDATNLLTYLGTGLTPETDYRARVRHKDDSGDGSTEWSSWATADTFTTSAVPSYTPGTGRKRRTPLPWM